MLRRYFGDYESFECLADKCPDTCCSGWLIQIDEDSLEWYKDLEKEKPSLMANKIDWSEGCFCNRENGDCAFLMESGLCELQKTMGEEALCYTCDMYPRHVEEFPEVREYSLSVSCPANALALVKKKEFYRLTETEDEQEDNPEDYEDFNELLFEHLLKCRRAIILILEMSDITFVEKSRLIIGTMCRIQDALDEGDWDAIDDILDDPMAGEDDLKARDYQRILGNLEALDETFAAWMQQALDSEELGEQICDDFTMALLCEYFIYTYFCGAAYNGYVYALAREAIFFAKLINLLMAARKRELKHELSDEERAWVVYKFSRELEHSDENLNALQEMMDEI